MTNAQIIFWESVDLMEAGIIGTTGRSVTVETKDGEKKQLFEPEAIHTFQAWKKLGRQVTKGQKAIAAFTIWKHCPARTTKDGEEKEARMIMKKAHFFKLDQTEPIKA